MKRTIILIVAIVLMSCGGSSTQSNDNGDGGTPATTTAPIITFLKTISPTFGSLWCIPVYDGTNVVISTEKNGSIYVAKYTTDLEQVGAEVEVASTADTAGGDNIADHKHIFQNGFHFIVFSTSGAGDGGYLYLLKLDTNLARQGIVTVVNNDPPTNDMILVGDGTYVYPGQFEPGTGHIIYKYDENLAYQEQFAAGGGDNSHGNGATALYKDGTFYIFAPNVLIAGEGDYVYKIEFDGNWTVTEARTILIELINSISLVTGSVFDSNSNTFFIDYTRATAEGGGDIYRGIFNTNWELLSDTEVVPGNKNHRPHTLIVGDRLFLGYDDEDNGTNFAIHLSSYSITPAE